MRKLVIVCEEKYRMFGDYLSQLISLDDDTDEKTVGTKDGEVAAQVWLEKEYLSNAAHVSSDQYILFIGYDKLIKEKSRHMNVMFSQFGMKYGWLGKQAVLSVEKIVSTAEYELFLTFGKQYQDNLEQLIEIKSAKSRIAEAGVTIEAESQVNSAPLIAAFPAAGIMVGKKLLAEGILAGKKLISNKKIEEQQYSCEIMKFYIDSLNEFLGL